MFYVNGKKEVNRLTSRLLDVLFPLESIAIKGTKRIYCPHCGNRIIRQNVENGDAIMKCYHCNKPFRYGRDLEGDRDYFYEEVNFDSSVQ